MPPLGRLPAAAAAVVAAVLILVTAAPPVSAQLTRNVCFITNWSQYRPGSCSWVPSMLNATLCTHIHYSFAYINAYNSLKFTEWNDKSDLVPQTMALRKQNPAVKILISVGGWSMNDPGSGYERRFSKSVSPAYRPKFINNTLAFLDRWGFDGLDIDWEYPGVLERGGTVADKGNLANFVKEYKAEASRRKKPYLLTLAAAAGADGYAGLNLGVLGQYLDYINIMTYDYHGAWDSQVNFLAPWKDVLGGTSDINSTLKYFINVAKVSPRKINLGLATYARSWRLADPARTAIGAPATGPAKAATCTGQAGYYAWFEVKQMIADGGDVYVSATARSAYMIYNKTTWLSFELPQTLYMKILGAQQWGLGGLMVWAADLDDADYTMLRLTKYKKDPGACIACFGAAVQASSSLSSQGATPAGDTILNPAGLFCSGGSVGNGVCQQKRLCCSRWGHCGAGYNWCSSDKGYCMGGPCQDYTGRPISQAAPISNGTFRADNPADSALYSRLKGALGGPTP